MKKVLVVDDSPMMRKLIGKLVRTKGCDVIEASNYDEATQQFEKHFPDIVMLDIIMDTQRSGLELLKKFKDESPGTKVIMVTSISDQHEVIKESVYSGADDYISKPFKSEELLNSVDRFL